MPEFGDIPSALVDFYLIETARDFCEKTGLYTNAFASFNTVIGTHTYTLTPPANTDILRVTDGVFGGASGVGGYTLTIKHEQEMDHQWQDWRSLPNGAPIYLVPAADNRTIRLVSPPNKVDAVKVIAELAPASSATTLPDFLFTNYREVIAHGVKQRVYANVKGKDKTVGEYWRNRYLLELPSRGDVIIRYSYGGYR
jgi:hypothetical protein